MKRILDVTLSGITLIIMSPFLLIVALLIRVLMGKPVFFRQDRPGLDERIFKIIKFRTMSCDTNSNGEPLPDERRMTRLGAILRQYSIDEMPELYNVLKGDMSLVGPRPLLVKYLDRYSPQQSRRHAARPGITGLAQIYGRNSLPWKVRFELDIWYIDNWSLRLDLAILAKTIWVVLRRKGISTEGYVTAPEFMGTEDISDKP